MVDAALKGVDRGREDLDFQKVLELVEERYGEMLDRFYAEIARRSGGTVIQKMKDQIGGGAGRRGIIWEHKAPIILGHLMLGKSDSEACSHAKVSTATTRLYRGSYPDWDQAFCAAVDDGFGVFEGEARRRAIDGVSEYVTSAGRVVMDPLNPGSPLIQKKHSDAVLMFLMKGKKPDVYGTRSAVSISGTINIEGSRDALLERLAPILIDLLKDELPALTDESYDSPEEALALGVSVDAEDSD